MKKLLITSIYLTVFSLGYSQNIKFTDENLKTQLIEQGLDMDENNEIDLDEAKLITTLMLNNSKITSLEGIQYFVNLEELGFENNAVKILDLSNFNKLRFLYASNNKISQLIFPKNNILEIITLKNNPLEKLDVAKCTKLQEVEFDHKIENFIAAK